MAKVSKKKSPGSALLSRYKAATEASTRKDKPMGATTTTNRIPRKITSSSSFSSKVGRTVIRSHHTLQKRLAQALARNDIETARIVNAEIAALGGLESYQKASINGQSTHRGGDSSKVLMDWIRDLQPPRAYTGKRKLRMLEVGSLSPDNAVSKSPLFSVTRIDLHSQHPGLIESQDFMLRPLPISDDDKFDVISLSLVLNYVPDPVARGEMLRRTVQFLRFEPSPQPEKPKRVENDSLARFSQSLFLVLPAPCVTNSRYLDERRLEAMMGSIGYAPVYRKLSSKLIYSLWRLDDDQAIKNPTKFKKEEVNPGKFRNNFAMTMV